MVDQCCNFSLLTAFFNYIVNLTCCARFKLFIWKTLGSKVRNEVPAPRYPKNDSTLGYCDNDDRHFTNIWCWFLLQLNLQFYINKSTVYVVTV